MSGSWTVDDYFRLASQLEGKRLTTAARKAAFRIRVNLAGLEITPEATGKSRTVPTSRIRRFLDEYNESRVRRPGHYHEITFDSSYLVAILSQAVSGDS
jgi:hypothetical protein